MKPRGKAVRDKIIDTAGKLFYQQGYNLTGINQVIEEADIAKRSLYHHFDSKTEILLSYLDKLQDDWYKHAAIYLKPFKSPKRKLLALFDYRIHNQLERNACGCAFVKINAEAGCTDERILKRAQKNKDLLKGYIHNILTEFDKLPDLGMSLPELTQMVYLMMEGGVTSTSIYKDVNELNAAKKLLDKLL